MKNFKENAVYIRVGFNTYLYVCEVQHGMAKLVEYKGSINNWKATGNVYRLRDRWVENEEDSLDFNNFITNPMVYEQVGVLDNNFVKIKDMLFAKAVAQK